MAKRKKISKYGYVDREDAKNFKGSCEGKIKKSGKDKEWTVSDLILCRGEGFQYQEEKNVNSIGEFKRSTEDEWDRVRSEEIGTYRKI
jgi:hypothetical protein